MSSSSSFLSSEGTFISGSPDSDVFSFYPLSLFCSRILSSISHCILWSCFWLLLAVTVCLNFLVSDDLDSSYRRMILKTKIWVLAVLDAGEMLQSGHSFSDPILQT